MSLKAGLIGVLILSLLSIFSLSSLSIGEYPYNDFNQGIGEYGVFNSNLSDCAANPSLCVPSAAIASPKFSPYVSDLDNDGVNEIIVIDGTNIRLYHGSSLSIVDSIDNGHTIHYVYIYDIDNDGLPEINIINSTKNIINYFYNGTGIYHDSLDVNLTAVGFPGTSDSRECQFACEAHNNCVVICASGAGIDCGTGSFTTADLYIRAQVFNSTSLYGSVQNVSNYETGAACNPQSFNECKPMIPYVDVKDTDGDGLMNYLFTYGEIRSQSTTASAIAYNVEVTNTITGTMTATSDAVNIVIPSATATCSDAIRSLYTSPLAYNFDGSGTNGLEIMRGYQNSATTFKLRSTSSTFTGATIYPAASNANGHLISNIVRAEIFPTSKGRDSACVLGYDTSLNELELMCANMESSSINNEWIFFLSAGYNFFSDNEHTPYNLSLINTYSMLIQASQQDASSIQHDDYIFGALSNNPDEISSPYGILKIWGAGAPFGYGGMDLIYENSKINSSVVMSDVLKSGRSDMLALTLSNLWYINDGYVNSPSYIYSSTVCPSYNSVWKQNTTVTVSIIPKDIDGDNVRARAILYYGTADEQDSNWSIFSASGTTFPFAFIANVTGSNKILRIITTDNVNNNTNISADYTFSVSSVGAEFGSACSTFTNETPVTPPANCTGTGCLAAPINFQNALQSLDGALMLNLGMKGFWILIMFLTAVAVVMVSVMFYLKEPSAYPIIFGAVAMVSLEVLELVFGFFIGFIGWGTVALIIIPCLILLGLYIGFKFSRGM